MKILSKIVYRLIIGVIVLLAINVIGGVFKFNISLNLLSAFVVGYLGIPGIILLVVLKYLF